MNREERERLDKIIERWSHLKAGAGGLSSAQLATATALWAALNVDYLIALAERGGRP